MTHKRVIQPEEKQTWHNPRGIIAEPLRFITYLLPSETSEDGAGQREIYTSFGLFLRAIGKLFKGQQHVCVCFIFSPRQGWRRCGQIVSVRGGVPEGKPPAEKWRVPRPEEDESMKGFDNFLQSNVKKKKSIPEDTRNRTLAISRSKHPVSEFFSEKALSEVHLIFCVCVCVCFIYSTSLLFNRTRRFFCSWNDSQTGSQGTRWR